MALLRPVPVDQRKCRRMSCRAQRLRRGSRFCAIRSQIKKLDRIDFEDISELFQPVDRGGMFLPLASIPT